MDDIEELEGVEFEEELSKQSSEDEEEETEEDTPEKEPASETHEHSDDAIKLYLKEIQATKLLTAQEERELAERISQGRRKGPQPDGRVQFASGC